MAIYSPSVNEQLPICSFTEGLSKLPNSQRWLEAALGPFSVPCALYQPPREAQSSLGSSTGQVGAPRGQS